MKVKEAVEWLEAEIKAQESGYAYAIANGQEGEPNFETWLNRMRLALNALKKQVPQKPINQINYEECPVCNNCIPESKMFVFCGHCGQRLLRGIAEEDR